MINSVVYCSISELGLLLFVTLGWLRAYFSFYAF